MRLDLWDGSPSGLNSQEKKMVFPTSELKSTLNFSVEKYILPCDLDDFSFLVTPRQ